MSFNQYVFTANRIECEVTLLCRFARRIFRVAANRDVRNNVTNKTVIAASAVAIVVNVATYRRWLELNFSTATTTTSLLLMLSSAY